MYSIRKQFSFSASHQLTSLDDSHPCARLHGHNYIVEIVLKSPSLNEHGFVVDYRELDALKAYIDETLDHRHLNEVLGDNKTTAESIAEHLFHWCKSHWPQTDSVRVSETPKTWAAFTASKL